jgi:hypothetical protein
MEMGNLSSREIEPDRAVAELFSHYGGGQQSRESGAEAVVEQAQHLAIALRRIRFDPLDLPMLLSEVSQATRVCLSLKTIGYRAAAIIPHAIVEERATFVARSTSQQILPSRSHAAAFDGLRTSGQWNGHPAAPTFPRPCQYYEYRALHRDESRCRRRASGTTGVTVASEGTPSPHGDARTASS